MTLTGARRAILRSLYVVVIAASLTALVTCVLPGYQTIYAESGAHVVPAGGPLLGLAMIAATMLAAIGLAIPRREITVLASGTLTVLAIPIVVCAAIAWADTDGVEIIALWPAQLLELALPIVALSGPLLATLGFVLFRLEARVIPSPIPVMTAR